MTSAVTHVGAPDFELLESIDQPSLEFRLGVAVGVALVVLACTS
jgi:hypothetical protein